MTVGMWKRQIGCRADDAWCVGWIEERFLLCASRRVRPSKLRASRSEREEKVAARFGRNDKLDDIPMKIDVGEVKFKPAPSKS